MMRTMREHGNYLVR